MCDTWPNLLALRAIRWPLRGGMEKSQWGAAEEAREQKRGRAWGSDRLGWETLDGEEQHRAVNRRVQRTDDIEPITREWEGETHRGHIYGVVQPYWNRVIRNQRKNA